MSETIIHTPTNDLLPHAAKVKAAEAFMKQLPQTFMPIREFTGHGLYTRVVFIPKDTLVIGKQHVHGQHNFLMLGSIEIATENGPVVYHAPDVIISGPGTKRAARTLTDVMWATVLPTDLTDTDEIERTFIHPDDCTAPPRIEGEIQS